MAYAIVASVKATPGENGGATAGIDTTGADFLVMVVSIFNQTALLANISDSKGNDWEELTNYHAGLCDVRIFYVINPTVGSGHTFTFTQSGTFPFIAAAAFSGANTSTPFDQETGAAGGTPGSITPSEDNELLITTEGDLTGLTPSVDGGFTLAEVQAFGSGVNVGGALAYLIQTTATAANPTWTAGGGSTVSAMACFKAASGTAVNRTAADAPSTSDSVARTLLAYRIPADTSSTVDAVTRLLTEMRTASDTPSTSDSVTRTSTLARTLSDTISSMSTSAALTWQLAAFRTATDAPSTADALDQDTVKFQTATDSPTVTDAATRLLTLFRTAEDTPSTASTVTGIKGQLVTAADAPSTVSAVTTALILSRTLADFPTITDTVTRLFVGQRSLSDLPFTTSVVTGQVAGLVIVAGVVSFKVQLSHVQVFAPQFAHVQAQTIAFSEE